MKIRRLKNEDGKAYLKLMLVIDEESKFMLYEPHERISTSEDMANEIKTINASGGVIMGAFEGDEMLGFISLVRGKTNRVRHCAFIMIGLMKRVEGKGIGTQMMKGLETWAIEQGISKLELTAMSHNYKAYQLYLQNGYEVEGTKKRSMLVDGVFYDAYYMGKII